MANKNQEELDLDVEKPAGKRNLILYIVIGVLVIALGATVALLLLKDDAPPAEQAAAEPAVPEAYYLPLDTMVVNFAKGPARFLQVDIQVMAHDKAVLDDIETHMPVIRNDILLLLGSQDYATVSTREGKEKLRTDIKAAIDKILQQQGGGGEVAAIYFTSFVMQ